MVRTYIAVRGPCDTEDEQFFVFKDKSAVTAEMARLLLRKLIDNLGLNSKLYNMHSFRIGRASDLVKYNYSVQAIKYGEVEIKCSV